MSVVCRWGPWRRRAVLLLSRVYVNELHLQNIYTEQLHGHTLRCYHRRRRLRLKVKGVIKCIKAKLLILPLIIIEVISYMQQDAVRSVSYCPLPRRFEDSLGRRGNALVMRGRNMEHTNSPFPPTHTLIHRSLSP